MSRVDWKMWGDLADRYKTEAPRRMLALDGGGIRGVVSLKILLELEDQLREHYKAGADFRLCQFFDYVGGTSTGAIIAASLAIGMSVRETLDFYEEFGPAVFSKRPWYERWKSLYGNGALQVKLQEVFGKKTDLVPPGVAPDDAERKRLRTLLLVVSRNATTDSSWPITSNPSAKYNDIHRRDCNLRIPLWELVRASTAAPVYFPPAVIQWDPHDESKHFVFVDGGTTSYNCPAFVMARMATEPAYKLGWKRGEDKLLVVSVGTGTAPVAGPSAEAPQTNVAESAVATLEALMSQAQFDQDVNCRTVGRCSHGPSLDRELNDLVITPLSEDLGRAFLYARYNAELTQSGLERLGLGDIDANDVTALDSTDHVPELARIGDAVAKQIDLNHYGSFIDHPLYTA